MAMEINSSGNWVKATNLDCMNTTSKDSWWCKAGSNFQVGMAFIFFCVILSIFALFDLFAIYGTVKVTKSALFLISEYFFKLKCRAHVGG